MVIIDFIVSFKCEINSRLKMVTGKGYHEMKFRFTSVSGDCLFININWIYVPKHPQILHVLVKPV